MYTTIKVSTTLKAMLDNMKMSASESYEDVIQDLVEDHMTVRPEVLKQLEKSKADLKKGKYITLAEMKAKYKR
ncbi:MAG: hypothetical protein WCT31_00510 [Candidatus Micrarchaeia archaeon]|jgi:flagellar motor component MotA